MKLLDPMFIVTVAYLLLVIHTGVYTYTLLHMVYMIYIVIVCIYITLHIAVGQ